MDDFVWLQHPETRGYFRCPSVAVDDWVDMGWQRSDPPEQPNPVIAEHLAWRAEQAKAQESKPVKAARRGDNTGEMSNG